MSQYWKIITLLAIAGWAPLTLAGCNQLEMKRYQAAHTPAPENLAARENAFESNPIKANPADSSSAKAAKPQKAKSQLKMGTHDVTVIPGSDNVAHSQMVQQLGERKIEHYEFQVGDKNVVIEDEKLYVNQKFYCDLKKGDTVLIEKERVHVNGKHIQLQRKDDDNTKIIILPPRPVKMPKFA